MMDVLEELKKKESTLREQLESARSTVEDLDTQIHRIRNAIASLLDEAPVAPSSKKVIKRPPTKQGFTLEETEERIVKALNKHGAQSKENLTQIIKGYADEEGKAKTGLHFRVNTVLQSGPFRESGERWSFE